MRWKYEEMNDRQRAMLPLPAEEETAAQARSDAFIRLCALHGLPSPVTEYRFHPVRRYRFDYAWVPFRVALEVEGGVWSRGAHGRGSGIIRDIAKYNLATVLGFRVVRVVPTDLLKEETFEMLKQLIPAGGERSSRD